MSVQINKIRNDKGEVTMDTREIHGIIRGYYQQLYANKMDTLEEIGQILRKVQLSKTEPGRNKIWTDQSQVMKLKLWFKTPNCNLKNPHKQMASAENSIKHLQKS